VKSDPAVAREADALLKKEIPDDKQAIDDRLEKLRALKAKLAAEVCVLLYYYLLPRSF